MEPNAAHHALARLQRDFSGKVILITQNVDDLHERAGSRNVIHMHGELRKVYCIRCHHHARWEGDLDVTIPCSSCGQAGGMRPDIVWFGEMPYQMDVIKQTLGSVDVFVAIGTSVMFFPQPDLCVLLLPMVRKHGRSTMTPPSYHAIFITTAPAPLHGKSPHGWMKC